MSMSIDAKARMDAHRAANGEFGPQQFNESGVKLGTSATGSALAGISEMLRSHLAPLDGGGHTFTDTDEERTGDPQGTRRAARYRMAAGRVEAIGSRGLSEAEQVAALSELASELNMQGLRSAGNAMQGTAQELHGSRLLDRWEGVADTDDLAFEETTAPADDIEAVAMSLYAARLKLSGITGTVRGARLSGAYAKTMDAEIIDPEGREFHLKMARDTLSIHRSDTAEVPAEFANLGRSSWQAGIVTPDIVRRAVTEARRDRAVADSWIANSGLTSNNSITFSDQEVIKDGLAEAAAFNAKLGDRTYRILRIMDRSTGTAETRVFTLGDEGRGVKTTTAIINEITEAAGMPFTRDMVEHRLAHFLDEALHDSSWQ